LLAALALSCRAAPVETRALGLTDRTRDGG